MKRGKPPKRYTRLNPMSKKRREQMSRLPFAPRSTVAPRGKRAWKAPRPAGYGFCPYRGPNCVAKDVAGPLTWDHTAQRSLSPELRDREDLLLAVCATCNQARGAGFKPPWNALPEAMRAKLLDLKGEVWARRYFVWLDVTPDHE